MNTSSKILLVVAVICLIDAIALLFYFDNTLGFYLGSLGFAVSLLSSALVSDKVFN